MNFLSTINESININKLKGATFNSVTNAFLANYVAALLMMKLQDLKGLILINDVSHSKLTKFSPQMSDVNFWGLALFYPLHPEVKNRMAPGEAELLAAESKHIQHTRIQAMMKVPLSAPSEVHWMEVCASLIALKHRYRITSSYYRNMLATILHWDQVSDNVKKKAVNNSFMYLMQADPHSHLLPRMRALSTTLLVKGIGSVATRIVSFKKIVEDGAISTGNIASSSQNSNAIVRGPSSPIPTANSDAVTQGVFKLDKMSKEQITKKGKYIFRDNKIVKKRKQKFKARKFKAPEAAKKTKEEENV